MPQKSPNIVYVFADQWRAQAFGYAGNPDVQTPHIDQLASESLNLSHAVAGISVCCPGRACLLTGQYPLTHGVFVNDVHLSDRAVSLAQAFGQAGYDTGYIGKWHVDGNGRSNYIPPERRQGFDYWKALECTHTYTESFYYAGNSDEKLTWDGYDAIAQTRDAQQYIRDHADNDSPFLLVLSWGPPHAPYETAPERYRAMYDPDKITLRPNVPTTSETDARKWIAGYYAHCTALDDCLTDLRSTLVDTGIADDTILVFTSDHGDMLGSQGSAKKQQPWDESIRVPFLLHYPRQFSTDGKTLDARIDTPDIMPTLLGLCDLPIPETVEGLDFSDYLKGGADPSNGAALLSCVHPFGQWLPSQGGREYRGVRTDRYTYVRDLNGPWLLYDNEADPYQHHNIVNQPAHADTQAHLESLLNEKLQATNDDFLPGMDYINQWGYPLDETGTVPYSW